MPDISDLVELVPWDTIFNALNDALSNPWGIVEVQNATDQELTLVDQAHHNRTGAFHPDFMPRLIVPPFSIERFGTKADAPFEGPDGHVTYRIGARGANVTWRIDWRLNYTATNEATATLDPANHPDYESLPATASTGVHGVRFGYAVRGNAPVPPRPGPNGGTTTDVPTSCVITVYNTTANPITLIDQGHERGGFTSIVPASVDAGQWVQFVSAETPGAAEGTKGYLVYDVGGGTSWRVEWDNPENAQNATSSTFDGPGAASFRGLDQIGQGEENVPTMFTLSGGTPGGGGQGDGTTSRCIIVVTNATDQVLTLVDQGHYRGNFFTQPRTVLPPGERDEFASVESQGVTDPSQQGSAGYVQYRIGDGDIYWTNRWDNPERAQNTTSSEVIGAPDGVRYDALDQIGEGDDNVPVAFTLSGGGTGPGPEEPEWTPPVEVEQPTLRRGDNHADGWVEYLQELLNGKLGLQLVVDGNFGPATESAVRQLQSQYDIQVDGIVGYQTWAVLRGETPAPASTDGRAPHTYAEGGAEARWYTEGSGGTYYDPGTDVLVLTVASVGDTDISAYSATMRFTGNDSGEVFVTTAPLGPPTAQHAQGGADHVIQVDGLRSAYGTGVHTVEAYLPAELGGDYITFQIRVGV